MLASLALLFSFIGLAKAEYGCSSFAQLTHTSSGCPANQGNPDCSFIQANAAQFCSTTATSWEIINGPNCNLRGASYGCIYAAGLYSTTDQFCCPLIVTGGAPATSATASASASVSASVSASASVTVTADATVSTSASASPSASVTGSPDASISTTTSASPSASASALSSPSALTTATSTSTPTLVLLTNYTNTTNVTATSKTVDKGLTEEDKIGMGIGIGLSIIIFIGCCYFGCIITRRPKKSKETENIERRPSQIERRPSQRSLRDTSKLEIRAPTTPRADSKV